MKTLSKKILTGCMTLAMACALAVPAFAAAPTIQPFSVYPGSTYTIRGYTSSLYAAASGDKVVLSSARTLWTPVN